MQLLETIRVEKGRFLNLDYHQDRMNNTRRVLFNCTNEIDLLSGLLNSSIHPDGQIQKCRVEYNKEVRKIELLPYQLPSIKSLKMIVCNDIDYGFKYLNRDRINELFAQKDEADDIIIIKDGMITDSSTTNLLFFNGKHWVTPTTPLLKGTQRAFLLEREVIQTAIICPTDLQYFEKVRLINAMIKFDDEVDVKIGEVFT
ncbi:MAG: aminotransferase class IV [Bacteroidetes bacterium]|nr:aminotransferase class IV [Bacteroidota bacterium]